MSKKLTSAVIAIALSTFSTVHANTEFPTKNIKIVVHTSAGGPTDLMAREVAKGIEAYTGKNVIIENKPGGSGAIAMNTVYSAKADGYTLGAMTPSQVGILNGVLKNQFSIDDFTWLSRSQIDPYVLVTQADSPYKSIDDVVKKLKDTPNSIGVGGYGSRGSAHNISWNIFAEVADISAEWIPYESTGDAVTALLGNEIQLANSNPGQVAQYVKAGKLKILAVNADERLENFPDTPTLHELGYMTDTDWVQFRGFFAPKNVPTEIIEKWDDILSNVYNSEQYQNYMQKEQMVEGKLNQEEYNNYIKGQNTMTKKWYGQLGLSK